MAIKTFTTGEVLTASDTNTFLANAGLVYITGTTVGTGTTLIMSNVFSATYNAYRFVFDNIKVASGTIFITAQLRAGSTTNTAGYYDSRLEVTTGGAVTGGAGVNVSGWTTTIVGDATYTSGAIVDVYNPFNAVQTSYNSQGVDPRTSGSPYRAGGGWHNSTTSFDGIVFTATTNFSTGNVRVYGYRIA
jgi:hypothetical protein